MKEIDQTIYTLFKKGSKTYFYSSIFFPEEIKRDVFVLYAFVRKADNFVDVLPQQAQQFYTFKQTYYDALNNVKSGDVVIDSFAELVKRKNFNREWVDAFLCSMEMDLANRSYNRLEQTLEYIYGSAEVIGLMMSVIMGLDTESYHSARHLGRAMQYINFIRDIDEDLKLNRQYLPLHNSGLSNLSKRELLMQTDHYKSFIEEQISIYFRWQEIAEQGYKYIPRRYRIPIKTAADLYKWTAETILKDPFIVFNKKVKPSLLRILVTLLKNSFINRGLK